MGSPSDCKRSLTDKHYKLTVINDIYKDKV